MRFGALAAIALAVFGCSADLRDARGPNVIVISLDTLRADRLGCYGYSRPTSPALDRHAAGGVLFEHAVAPSPWTMPSHASLFTGRLPARHGVERLDSQLAPGVPTLAETLRNAGFQTAAFVNSPYLGPKTGIGRGFDHYHELPKVDPATKQQVLSAESSIAEIRTWLDAHGRLPFFVFLHTYDVHSDYQPGPRYRELLVRPYEGTFDGTSVKLRQVLKKRFQPSPKDVTYASDLYDAAVRQLDDRLATLLAYLEESGLAKTTTVIITSDHGEEFFEHGSVMHGYTVYEEMLRVPLIMRGPHIPAGVRVSEQVQLTDVAPTVLALLGVPAPPGIDGRNLVPTWSRADDPPSPAPLAFAESVPRKYAPDVVEHLVSVRGERFKLIHDFTAGRSLLYDLGADPQERRDLAGEKPDVVAELLRHAEAYRSGKQQGRGGVEYSPDEMDQLRALGYAE